MKCYPLISLLLMSACAPVGSFGSIQSAAGEQPGYYAGLSDKVYDFNRPKWQQWYTSNQVGIADIQQKIDQIKAGTLTPGCIGRDPNTCVATLSQTLSVADNYAVSNLFAKENRDVNGKIISKHIILITGYIPGVRDILERTTALQITLSLNNDHSVKSVSAMLPHDPLYAKTQEEYDKTGSYEIIAAMTKADCPELSHTEVARFIENSVKPKGKFTGERWSFDNGITRTNGKAANNIKFCGRSMEFYSSYGQSSDLATMNNPHGAFGGVTIIFK